jgi:formiminoglutamase
MQNIVPVNIEVPANRPDDPRFAEWLQRPEATRRFRPKVAIIGFPVDEGVRINGGRTGAAAAPDEIRKWLYRMTPDPRVLNTFLALLEETIDLGNVIPTGNLESDQVSLGEAIGDCLSRDIIPIVLGGGHETAFGHFLGYVHANRHVSIVNVDAHADVRPLVGDMGHSGSPFRQAIEHVSQLLVKYTVAGLVPHATSGEHVRWLRENRGIVIWRDELRVSHQHSPFTFDPANCRTAARHESNELSAQEWMGSDLTPAIEDESIREEYSREAPSIMASFDLDAVDQAFAPGVSAPNGQGLNPEQWLTLAEQAGLNPQVRSFELVEMNPCFDRDGQSARLAALTIWRFMRGLAARLHANNEK